MTLTEIFNSWYKILPYECVDLDRSYDYCGIEKCRFPHSFYTALHIPMRNILFKDSIHQSFKIHKY